MKTNLLTNLNPIILLGCHRSGTSYLASLLKKNNLFIGNDLNDHFESTYFLSINDALLSSANSTWSDPTNFITRLNDAEFQLISVDLILRKLNSLNFCSQFLGISGSFQLITNSLFSWGWKDPRTSITFPLWLRVFPNCRVIHITRNVEEVAKSLQEREIKRSHFCKFKGEKCKDLEYAKNLWAIYEDSIRNTTRNIIPNNLMHICFNDLIKQNNLPENIIKFIES